MGSRERLSFTVMGGLVEGPDQNTYPRFFCLNIRYISYLQSSQVNTLPIAKSKTRSKQNKDMHICSSVYSERGVPLPVLTSGGD
jgi:hypothetical protein